MQDAGNRPCILHPASCILPTDLLDSNDYAADTSGIDLAGRDLALFMTRRGDPGL